MNSPAPKISIPLMTRCARWALDCAVKHWPEESRPWGLALSAEIDEAANPFEAFRWSLGGIMFFARSVFSDAWKWMKLPAGSSLSGGVADEPGGPSLLPKRSRLFTTVVLIAAVAVLLLPQGREAVTLVRSSWEGFHEPPSDRRANWWDYSQSNSDRRTLEKLAARAEKENDAATLAFVALSFSNEDAPDLNAKRFGAWADRAVSLDPSFIWIYGARTHWPTYVPAREGRLERLQAADPDNAVPKLLEADAWAESRMAALGENRSFTDPEIRTVLGGDPKWMALMNQAFTSSSYDSYFQRHYELMRAVWNHERYLSPMAILGGLQVHAIPNLYRMRMFSEIKMQEAEKVFASGDWKQAQNLVGEVDLFGRRMFNSNGTKIEKIIGLMLERDANRKLAALSTSAGLPLEAQKFELRVRQIDGSWAGMRPSVATNTGFRRSGILVQAFGSLAIIAAVATLFGIVLIELWPVRFANQETLSRKVLCWTADYAPATFLAASCVFLLSFLPFAHALAEYRSLSYADYNEEHVMGGLWSLFAIPAYFLSGVGRISIWSIVTVALSALAVFIVARSFYRARRVHPKHA